MHSARPILRSGITQHPVAGLARDQLGRDSCRLWRIVVPDWMKCLRPGMPAQTTAIGTSRVGSSDWPDGHWSARAIPGRAWGAVSGEGKVSDA